MYQGFEVLRVSLEFAILGLVLGALGLGLEVHGATISCLRSFHFWPRECMSGRSPEVRTVSC